MANKVLFGEGAHSLCRWWMWEPRCKNIHILQLAFLCGFKFHLCSLLVIWPWGSYWTSKTWKLLWGLNELTCLTQFSHLQKGVTGSDQWISNYFQISQVFPGCLHWGKKERIRVGCDQPAMSLLPPSPLQPEQLFFCLL